LYILLALLFYHRRKKIKWCCVISTLYRFVFQ